MEGFTRDTFRWGDYIADVWTDWTRDPAGRTFVACPDGTDEPVALAHVHCVTTGEAWLEGLRVHPDHRRQGIANALNAACCRWAASQGARVARLATEPDNRAPRRQVARLGWTEVARFAAMTSDREAARLANAAATDPLADAPESTDAGSLAPVGDNPGRGGTAPDGAASPAGAAAPTGAATLLRAAHTDDLPALLRLRSDANPRLQAASGGLAVRHWRWHAMTETSLAEAVATGRVLLSDAGFAVLGDDPDEIWIEWLEGPDEALTELAGAALTHCGPVCRAMPPDYGPAIGAWEAAGLMRWLDMIVYERRLAPQEGGA